MPQHVWQRLQAGGAQLVDMSHEKTIYPTLWRFLVMDDPTVERFLVRDADSLLSEREQVCVEAWLRSPWYFHHMRDYFTHTELLLAGMWAGCGGIFPNVARMMREFVVQYRGNARFTDQYFLKAVLWSTVRQSLLSHDAIFGFIMLNPGRRILLFAGRQNTSTSGVMPGLRSWPGQAINKTGKSRLCC